MISEDCNRGGEGEGLQRAALGAHDHVLGGEHEDGREAEAALALLRAGLGGAPVFLLGVRLRTYTQVEEARYAPPAGCPPPRASASSRGSAAPRSPWRAARRRRAAPRGAS